MLDLPIESIYVWLGVSLASLVLLGAVGSVPSTPGPDAVGVADTVDAVAASTHAATAEHPLAADELRVGPHRVGLRTDAKTVHESFAFGPVTPAGTNEKLRRVLEGAPPDRVFDSREAFRQAVIEARTTEPRWRPADGALRIRSLSWGTIDVTLVG